jgi:hypothetical protein
VVLMRDLLRRREHDEGGALAVVVAASAVMIFVLAALVVDLGLARDTDRQAQNSADAAALAAGNALYDVGKTPQFDLAVAAAKDYAATNFGVTDADWATCTDASPLAYAHPGAPQCISFDDDGLPLGDDDELPTEVRVVIPPRRVDTPLASVIGTNHVDVSGTAQMRLKPNAKSRCALCVVGPGPHDLQNGDIEVNGGDVHFNGSVTVGPNGLVATDGAITVEGTAGGGAARYEPDPLIGQPAIRDPLEFMPPIDYSALTTKTNPCTAPPAGGPGKYGGYASSCSSLPSGLYVITGEWKFTGNENLLGSDVTLYFTCGTAATPRPCNPGESGGWLNASGNGTISLDAPDSGPTQGLVIVYDRNNKSALRLTGEGGSSYEGTIYAPSATLDYRGNGAGIADSLIVVGSLSFSGTNASMTPTYDGDSNVPMPPSDLHLSR